MITSNDVEQIVKLLEQKETLQSQVARIDADLATYEGGEAAKAAKGKRGRKPARQAQGKPAKVKRAKRGVVKAAIVDLVKGAGKPGITIKDIAGKLGLGYNRVFNWFYATGRTIKEIKKAGPGKYAWTGAK